MCKKDGRPHHRDNIHRTNTFARIFPKWHPMCRGFVLAAADPGLSPALGPFNVCHSPSLSSCFLSRLQLFYQMKKSPTPTKTCHALLYFLHIINNVHEALIKGFRFGLVHLTSFFPFFFFIINLIYLPTLSILPSFPSICFMLSHFQSIT